MHMRDAVLYWATLHFLTSGVSSEGEGACHLWSVQDRTSHGPPSSHTCLADTSAALRENILTWDLIRKLKGRKELGKMLKLSIIHLGHLLLTSLAKAECKKEGSGRAIWDSQSQIILPVILNSEGQGVKLRWLELLVSPCSIELHIRNWQSLWKLQIALQISVMTSPRMRMLLFPWRAAVCRHVPLSCAFSMTDFLSKKHLV